MEHVHVKISKNAAAALRYQAERIEACQNAGEIARVSSEVDNIAFQLINLAVEVKNAERKAA